MSARHVHPHRFVTFTRDHVIERPATTLEGRDMKTGEPYTIAEIPASSSAYSMGQTLEFGSVNAARGFVKAVNEEAGVIVCTIGRETRL